MKKKVEEYLLSNIPLSRFMQIEVVECNAEISRLKAPLGPNVNDKGIGFGGSIAVMAKLAAWAKFYEYHERNQVDGELLISKCESQFSKPARGDLEAICHSPKEEDWQTFEKFLDKKGSGRILLTSEVFSAGEKVMSMTAHFVSVRGFK